MTTTGRGIAVTGPKLIYTPNGKRCYAYSGGQSTDNTQLDLLNFQTGLHVISGEFVFIYATIGNHDFEYKIYLNGVIVFNQFMENTAGDNKHKSNQLFAMPFILPPVTTVRCTAQNVTATDTESQACNFVGIVDLDE